MEIRRSELAALLGVSKAAVSQWLGEGGRAPVERCPSIERASGGKVTVEQLRPDANWQRVPDDQWPHPGGRPCIDVAAPAREAA